MTDYVLCRYCSSRAFRLSLALNGRLGSSFRNTKLKGLPSSLVVYLWCCLGGLLSEWLWKCMAFSCYSGMTCCSLDWKFVSSNFYVQLYMVVVRWELRYGKPTVSEWLSDDIFVIRIFTSEGGEVVHAYSPYLRWCWIFAQRTWLWGVPLPPIIGDGRKGHPAKIALMH